MPKTRNATLVLAATLAALWAPTPSRAAALLPPDLDYAGHCAAAPAETVAPLDRDWTGWQGEPVDLPADQVYALASEYARGSDRVEKSVETALRMFTWLEGQPGASRPRLDRTIGRLLFAPGATPEQLEEAQTRLERALASGEPRAAIELANLYGPTGPVAFRDAPRASAMAQAAAASGNAEGKLMFATFLNGDPAIAAEQKAAATEAALLALVGEIVKGNCSYLSTVGMLYLRGDLVEPDIPTAIAWFEQAAETGDARVEERLGDLISGPRVEVNDFRLAMQYYEHAADQGRAPSALKVGQDYATGLVRARDLERARHYLGIAADAGLRDGNLWLARLNYGIFGGARDWPSARRYYEAALAIGAYDAELATEYGTALIDNSAGPADLAAARALLTEAAYSGSGIAAVRVGELLIAEAPADPALYTEIETFMRLGDSLGRSEAARHMAELSLCAGPLFNPAAVAGWYDRALALGANALILTQGANLLASPDAAKHARGQALVRQLAMSGDARGAGFTLAQLRSSAGLFGPDPDLLGRLEAFVAGNADDPAFMQEFDLARIGAEMALPDAAEKLDAALETLDTYIAAGNANALVLKADLLKDHRNATATELIPLYRQAADLGAVKAMRELGAALLAQGADAASARTWLKKAADGGDIKAALRLIDTTTASAPAEIRAIADSGAVCSVDGMVSIARTYAATTAPEAPAEAARWLDTATQIAGARPSDLVRIASAYTAGIAGADAVARAEPLLVAAMQGGSTEAAVKLADGHIDGAWPDADPDVAHQLLAGLAADGDPGAAAELLRAVSRGRIGMPAAEVTRLAEVAGPRLANDGSTLVRLARLDEEGAFGTPDPERQFRWLQAAAAAGDAGAMMRLYRSYASGIGVAASPDEAFAWLKKAADIGDPRAVKEIAAAYTVGFGTAADPERAAYWRARAQVN